MFVRCRYNTDCNGERVSSCRAVCRGRTTGVARGIELRAHNIIVIIPTYYRDGILLLLLGIYLYYIIVHTTLPGNGSRWMPVRNGTKKVPCIVYIMCLYTYIYMYMCVCIFYSRIYRIYIYTLLYYILCTYTFGGIKQQIFCVLPPPS